MKRALPLLVLLAACSEYDLATSQYDDFFEQVDVVVTSDVLFVVDDSASMREEQELLRANFRAFLEPLADSQADFQVGVTTTDVTAAEAGLLRGGIFDGDTIMLERQLGAALMVGTKGDRSERGMEAAHLALDGRNPGFPREGAMISVVVVSDEDDESDKSIRTYIDALAERAGEASFGVHGIVGDLPNGCATGTTAAAPGPRYAEAIALSAGYHESICSSDYSELLNRVGLEVAGLPDTFPLSKIPAVETLEVFVDEVQIPLREVDGWFYEPSGNAIVFTGRAIPRPGMVVGVTYSAFVADNRE